MTIAFAILICFLAGIASGVFGIGGGMVLVPLLHYGLKMNIHAAIGTSLAMIIPAAIAGAIRHGMHGHVDWKIVFLSCAFLIVGAYLGATISVKLDAHLLRKMFAALLVLVAIKMFLD